MLELSEVKNTATVTEYLTANLGKTEGIAAYLIGQLNLKPTIKVLVPRDTDSERILKLNQGGITDTSKSYTWILSRLKILSNLETSKVGTLVAQDTWMGKSDYPPPFSYCKNNIFFSLKKPYFWIPCAKINLESVTSLLDSPSSFVSLYAYSAYSLKSDILENGADISAFEMELLKNGIREYYISAYDRESFIIISMV
jgi:hypothetical protein